MLQKPVSDLRIGCVPYQLFFPYWTTITQGIHTRASELDVKLCMPHTDADDEPALAIDEVVRQRPDVAILQGNLTILQPYAAQVFHDAGIPIVVAEQEPRADFTCTIRADEPRGAEAIVTYLFKRIGGRGKVLNLSGGQTARETAFHAVLAQHPGVELAYQAEGQWEREPAAAITRAALAAHPDLRGIFAHNDHMALGAADAVAERGLVDQIVVVGFDADPEGLIAVRDGRLAATVYRGLYGIGRTALDYAARFAHGEQIPREVHTPTTLITAANLVDATLDTTSLLPGLLRDFIASSRAERRLQRETIARQQSLIQELSTPILPISDAILIMPLVGTIDGARAELIMETMLASIGQHGARFMIVDITGIPVVDTDIAQHLIRSALAVQLLGAEFILAGIRPEVAQTMVGLGIDFRTISTHSTLQHGFAYAQRRLAAKR